jgi:hypothetical protein
MGRNTYYGVGGVFDHQTIVSVAQSLIDTGLARARYRIVGWTSAGASDQRDATAITEVVRDHRTTEGAGQASFSGPASGLAGARGCPQALAFLCVSSAPEPFIVTALIASHKRAAAAIVGVFILMIAITVVPSLASPSAGSLGDSSTCSRWEAAASSQQTGYGHLYLKEYRPAPDTAANANEVAQTISRACVQAAYLGEADNLSVIAAFRHEF